MKVLIVYYSRTGRTQKIAEIVQDNFDADICEINDYKNRSGLLGWILAGRDAEKKSTTTIHDLNYDPSLYDVVIIGSPTWNGTVSTPIRTFIQMYNASLRHVALFSTGDSPEPVAVEEMKILLGKKVFAWVHFSRKEDLDNDNYTHKLDKFIVKVLSFMR